MANIRKTINRYTVYVVIVYLGLFCFSPAFHNHYNYAVPFYHKPVKKYTGADKIKIARILPTSRTSVCPACVFENNNTGSFNLHTHSKIDYFAAILLPSRSRLAELSLLLLSHVRAPPVTIS